jgi:tetratricopeptide (TPR) repeat protein
MKKRAIVWSVLWLITLANLVWAQDSVPPPADTSTATNAEERIGFLLDAGLKYSDEGEFEEAERAYLRAMESDPGNAVIRFRLSTLYILAHRYRESEQLLKELAVEFPENAEIHNNLAWIYSVGGEMKNGALALRHAREALLISPYSPALWNTLAEAYYVFGQYDKALRAAECAAEELQIQQAAAEQTEKEQTEKDKADKEKDLRAYQQQIEKIRRAMEVHKQLFDLK